MIKNELTKSELISLLEIYSNLLPPRWSALHSYTNLYITLNTTIFGGTILGMNYFNTYPLITALFIGPLISFFISHLAKNTIKKHNELIKELVVVIAKLEFEIGLYEKCLTTNMNESLRPWKDDNNFLVSKWINGRINSGDKSETFVKNFKGSSAKLIHRIFFIFQILAFFLLILLILYPLIKH